MMDIGTILGEEDMKVNQEQTAAIRWGDLPVGTENTIVHLLSVYRCTGKKEENRYNRCGRKIDRKSEDTKSRWGRRF